MNKWVSIPILLAIIGMVFLISDSIWDQPFFYAAALTLFAQCAGIVSRKHKQNPESKFWYKLEYFRCCLAHEPLPERKNK